MSRLPARSEGATSSRPLRCLRSWTVLALLAMGALDADASEAPWLRDVTELAGLRFDHQAALSDSYFYPETFGAGVALFDLDGDGDLDLLLLDSGSPPGASVAVRPRSLLLRHSGVGPDGVPHFEAVEEQPPLAGLTAMGACVGDVDRDGDPDVYVTGLPTGRLLLNVEGSLQPAPSSGLQDPGWSSSCTFLDHDLDGDLDLYVVHYVDWSHDAERQCGGEIKGFRSYCPPSTYPAQADRLFAGDGKGRFADISAQSGISDTARRGLGVVAADFNLDGWPDLYVANDEDRNSLLLGSAGGRFSEKGLPSGTALGPEGKPQAGMGVDAADLNADGVPDLWVTNLDLETNNLYLSRRPGKTPRFRDAVHSAGLGKLSLMVLGFGTAFADLDLDGDQDLFVANGHIIPEIAVLRPDQVWAMPDQLFENVGGATRPEFVDASESWMPAAKRALVSRGLALGDLDDDGDLDLVVTSNDGPARLLLNETRAPGLWLGLELVASRCAPGAPLARASLPVSGGASRVAFRRTGGSYLSAHDERLVFSLRGIADPGTGHLVEVSWPGGESEWFGPLTAGRYHSVVEGRGRRKAADAPAPQSRPAKEPTGSPR